MIIPGPVDFAIVVPMANEEAEFEEFSSSLIKVLDKVKSGTTYFVVDKASKDNTYQLSLDLSKRDPRFKTIWAPENKNVVDAYIRGYKEALKAGHEFIIEMDAGLSHDPFAIPMFLRVLNEGNECAFGSRFINGGSMLESPWKRRFLSRFGTFLCNTLLGTGLKDMTSGYQGFHASVARQFTEYPLLSKAHFYQSEIRYLLRRKRFAEVPIHYRVPSPSVSSGAIKNSISTLMYYFTKRLKGKAVVLH